MGIKKVKISELPPCESLGGVCTIGVDKDNRSVKVGLGFVVDAASQANEAAKAATEAAQEMIARSNTPLDVVAHALCGLEERVAALESLLLDVLSGQMLVPELQVKKLGVWGENNLVAMGAGAPAKAPDKAGQFYIDTATRALYYSTGNAAVSEWKNK